MSGKTIRALIAAAALGAAAAGTAGAVGIGTTGADFLKVAVGARPAAMGGAFSALADDAQAIHWNPGALGAIKTRGVTASYNSLFQDENQGFLGYVHPTDGLGTFGAAVNYLSVSSIQKRAGDTESADSTFSDQNYAFAASYGRAVPIEGLSVGGNLKYIHESLDAFNGNAVALDAGAQYRTPIENLSAGAVMRNLGSKIGPDPLPLEFQGGVAYRAFQQRLALATDVDWLAVDQRAYWDVGGEFWVQKGLALRAGYQFGHGQDQLSDRLVGFGVGGGVRVDRFSLDYAFLPFGDLGDTHRVTVGWTF